LAVAFFLGAQHDATVPLLTLPAAFAADGRGPTSDPDNPLFQHVGTNYEFVARRRKMSRLYRDPLGGVPGVRHQPDRTVFAEDIYWVYGLVLDDDVSFDAAEAMRRLAKLNVQTRPVFWPMHEQPVFRKMGLYAGESHPVADYLPSGMALTEVQIGTVADAVREVLH
jgi:perosamine synthetase